jgi:hypothetical protein
LRPALKSDESEDGNASPRSGPKGTTALFFMGEESP